MIHREPLVKHHETLLKHCETSFDATISALDAETSEIAQSPHGKLEQDLPEGYSKFCGLYITISGSWKLALDLVRSTEKAG